MLNIPTMFGFDRFYNGLTFSNANSMQETPPMHLITSPTSFERPRGRKIRFSFDFLICNCDWLEYLAGYEDWGERGRRGLVSHRPHIGLTSVPHRPHLDLTSVTHHWDQKDIHHHRVGPRKNIDMAGVDHLVVYMQTAVKYSSLYIHHPGGASRPQGGVYRKCCILQQFAYTPPNGPHQPFPCFF